MHSLKSRSIPSHTKQHVVPPSHALSSRVSSTAPRTPLNTRPLSTISSNMSRQVSLRHSFNRQPRASSSPYRSYSHVRTSLTRQVPFSRMSRRVVMGSSTSLLKLPTIQTGQHSNNPTHLLSRLFSTSNTINITYIEPSGEPVTLTVPKDQREGESLMTLAVKNSVDMEGSCDGQIACSTCHCVLSQEFYDYLNKVKPATDEELDMLDTAFGLTDTSRLGCQIDLTLIDDDLTVTLPAFSR